MIDFQNKYIRRFSILLTIVAGVYTLINSHSRSQFAHNQDIKFLANQIAATKSPEKLTMPEKLLVDMVADDSLKNMQVKTPQSQPVVLELTASKGDYLVLIERAKSPQPYTILLDIEKTPETTKFIGKKKGEQLGYLQDGQLVEIEIIDIIRGKK